MTIRHDLVFLASFALLILIGNNSFSQLTQKEIYQLKLNVQASKKSGDKPENVAHYFIQMGLEQQKRLRLEQRRGQLNAASLLKLESLENALGPINDMYANMRNGLPSSVTAEEARDLFFDIESANRVFATIGEDEAIRWTVERAFSSLKTLSENARENAYSPVNLFANETIAKLLAFTDQQIEGIEAITKKAKEDLRVGSRPEFEKLNRLLKSHWERLLFELESEQKSMAVELIGEPVQWFRNAGSQKLKTLEFRSGNFTVASGSIPPIKAPDGRTIYQMTKEKLDSRGLNCFSTVTYRMLESQFVWDELELTSEQRNGIQKASKTVDFASSKFDKSRISELLGRKASLPKSVISVLTEGQCTWFRQMELQIYTAKYASSVGLLHASVVSAFKLKAGQIDNIQVLASDFEIKAESLMQIITEERGQIQKDFNSDVRQLLTDKQKSKFDKLSGRAPN